MSDAAMTEEGDISEDALRFLRELIHSASATGLAPLVKEVRRDEAKRRLLQELEAKGLVKSGELLVPTLAGVARLGEDGAHVVEAMRLLVPALQAVGRANPSGPWAVADVIASLAATLADTRADGELRLALTLLSQPPLSLVGADEALHPRPYREALWLHDSIMDALPEDIPNGTRREPRPGTEEEVRESLELLVSATSENEEVSAAPFRMGALGTRTGFLSLVSRGLARGSFPKTAPTHRGLLTSKGPRARALLNDAALLIGALKERFKDGTDTCDLAALATEFGWTTKRVERAVGVSNLIAPAGFWSQWTSTHITLHDGVYDLKPEMLFEARREDEPGAVPVFGVQFETTADSAAEVLARYQRFEVGDRIGRGEHGEVFRGTDPLLDHRHVALKFLSPEAAAELGATKQASALARVQHPNVLTVHGMGRARHPERATEELCIVLELVADAVELDEMIADPNISVSAREALEIAEDLLSALDAIHAAGLVHGDLHGGNILLSKVWRLKVIDLHFVEDRLRRSTASRASLVAHDCQYVGGKPLWLLLNKAGVGRDTLSDFDVVARRATSVADLRRALRPLADASTVASEIEPDALLSEAIRAVQPQTTIAQDEALHRLRNGEDGWNELCRVDSGQRRIDGALDALAHESFALQMRRAATTAGDALPLVQRQESLFAAAARRFQLGAPAGHVADLAQLLVVATARWGERYAGSGRFSPVTRKGAEATNTLDGRGFVADCWAWSLHMPKPDGLAGATPSLFPGWFDVSWRSLPAWWSELDGDGESGTRLLSLAEGLAPRFLGELPERLPPLFLPPLLHLLEPATAIAHAAFNHGWVLRELVRKDADRAWELALGTLELQDASSRMLGAGAADAPEHVGELLDRHVNSRKFSAVFTNDMPHHLALAVLERMLAGAFAEAHVLDFQMRVASCAREWSSERFDAVVTPLLRRLLSASARGVSACATSLMWELRPEAALAELRASTSNNENLLRLLRSVPPSYRAAALDVIRPLELNDELCAFLRRLAGLADEDPVAAAAAWEAVRRSDSQLRDRELPANAPEQKRSVD